MEDIILVKQDPNSSYELSEFKAKQELRKQYMSESLNRYYKQIVAVVTKVNVFVLQSLTEFEGMSSSSRRKWWSIQNYRNIQRRKRRKKFTKAEILYYI